jgi:alkylation response protein AidB-like acyl-CoA dehydrogenase
MDFRLTEEQAMVRETARELFSKECGIDFVHSAWSDRRVAASLFDEQLSGWMELAEADAVDVILFVEEHGRAVAPGVFFPSLLAAQVAASAGRQLAGSASVAIAGADGIWTPHDDERKHFVPCAGEVDELVVVSGSADAPRLEILRADGVAKSEVDQMDRLRPQYRVEARVGRDGVAIDPDAWRHAVERCLVLCSAELIGVGRWLLDTSVEYAKERVQFDRPIGSFQGLQWELVDAALELERAGAAVAYAAMCVDADDPDRHRAVHGAKADAGLAARTCAKTGMQVHGGIGYTWEHGLHFWLRRAYAGDAFMGPSSFHHDRLAELLFDR